MKLKQLSANTLVFLAILVLILLWFLSGLFGGGADQAAGRTAPSVPTVGASWSEAEEITRELVIYGEVEPNQVSQLRARTDGIIEEIVAEGARVDADEVVARLSTDDRQARLARAQAQVNATQRDYERATRLSEQGLAPDSDVESLAAQLEAARAELSAIELDIANTRLRAPIAGVVNRVIAEIGSYVSSAGEVLQIVDNDPLIAVVRVQQRDIGRIREGMPARVRFLGAEEAEGRMVFISPLADATTRTFRAEIAIDNGERRLPSGFSAEVSIPTDTLSAHRLSPALVRLDPQGEIGVHVVGDDQRIDFVPIEIVRARADGIWVSGLPARARIVTVSQGLLAEGQEVEVRETPEAYLTGAGGAR